MYNLDKFKHVIVAFYSSYGKNGEVSTEAALRQAQFYKEKGIKGLYLCGSSGEGFLMNVEERKKISEAVAREYKDDMTIIVHVGAAATKESVELARHAEEIGADAIAAVPNVYYRVPEYSIKYHWDTIIKSTELPFIIYNIPQFTGYDLSMNLLNKMIMNKKVIGVKNSSLSSYQIEQFKKAGGDNFLVFNGPDEQYLAGRIMGADAGIGGTYGAMPELFLKLEKCFTEGNLKEAQKWQIRINEVISELCSFPCLYAALKEVLRLRGVDTGIPRAPMIPLKKAELPKVKRIHDKILKFLEQI